jgi:hypothetical protein
MAAPVWNSIELDAVRKLHFVRLVKFLDFLRPFCLPTQMVQLSRLFTFDFRVINKFKLLELLELLPTWRRILSPFQPGRMGILCTRLRAIRI